MNFRIIFTVCATAICLSVIQNANAACDFASKFPIACAGYENAAIVYRKYGFDSERIMQSYTRASLKEHGCDAIYGLGSGKNKSIEITNHKRVPLDDGWAEVSALVVDGPTGKQLFIVDDHYISGKCSTFVPPVHVCESCAKDAGQ